MGGKMVKRMTFKKILISTLFLLVALILYSFPQELQQHINIEQEKKYNKIYLIDEKKYVSMVDMASSSTSVNERIKEIVDSLTIDSSLNDNIPDGFKPIIPSGTILKEFSLQDGLLKLNFNKNFLNVAVDDEEKMIEALVFSLTTINEVKKIMIFIEGEKLLELPQSHKKIDLYLDRSFGINKVYDISTFYDTKMVTVYYLDSHGNYYIPISHIVNDENDKIDIVIKNLKTNSFNNSNLSSHLNYQVELMNYEFNENNIIMNFNEVLLNSVYDGKLKEEVKYAIYYSIHDTLGIDEVVFLINSEQIDQFRLEN